MKTLFFTIAAFLSIGAQAQSGVNSFCKYEPARYAHMKQTIVRGDWEISEATGILTVSEKNGLLTRNILSTTQKEQYMFAIDNSGSLHIIPVFSSSTGNNSLARVSSNDPDMQDAPASQPVASSR